ncbi:sensor histidine kinase [Embleya sp. AB8]|uniref:sensor histidine kinase n=1 Tax=Embleya sp. AB8 TaxID=3156304 RepID=UPI003C70AE64
MSADHAASTGGPGADVAAAVTGSPGASGTVRARVGDAVDAPDAVDAASTGRMRGMRRWVLREAVGLRDELFDVRVRTERPPAPFRSRAVARGLLLVTVVITVGIQGAVLTGYPGVSGGLAFALGVATGAPILLAPQRPLPAWWLSLAGTVACALAATPEGVHGRSPSGGMQWPWSAVGVFVQVVVMAYVAFHGRGRVVVVTWGLTTVFGVLLVRAGQPGPAHWGTMPAVAMLTAIVMVVVVAFRGRSDARRELAVQSDLAAGERERSALLEERARIARELHDVVAHHMSVIAIQAEAAPYRVADPPPELVRSFVTIRANAVDALAELRRVLGLLRTEQEGGVELAGTGRPAPLPTLDRLPELIENVRAAGMRVDCVTVGARRPLPQGVDLSAYRIGQEALSNALRHAPGARVRVEVAYVPTGIGLRVHNEPPPAPRPSAREGSGQGVLGMRERAAMTGGTLEAGHTPDGGYHVDVFLPTEEQ